MESIAAWASMLLVLLVPMVGWLFKTVIGYGRDIATLNAQNSAVADDIAEVKMTLRDIRAEMRRHNGGT